MSFRGRLFVFFTIIVIVPMAAVAVVLFKVTSDSETGKADARIAQGLQTALAVYETSASRARGALADVANDPAFSRAMRRRDAAGLRRRARALLRSEGLQEIVFFDRRGRRVGGARRVPAVAFATAAPSTKKEGRLGLLAVSRTSATQYVGVARRLTGLEVRLVRSGRPIASSIDEFTDLPSGSGRLEVNGVDYRARYQPVRTGPLPPVSIGVLDRVDTGAIRDSRFVIAAFLIAFLVLALLTSILGVARGLQRQLADFLQAAQRLGRGDFDHPVPIHGNDEFASLGVEFNNMSEELKTHIAELERKRAELEENIRRVGEAVAAGLDRQGIVDLTVRTAVDACSAEAGRAIPIDLRKMERAEIGVEDDGLAAGLEAAERNAFAIHPGIGRELLAGLDVDGDVNAFDHLPSVAQANGVHSMALPVRARVAGGRDLDYVGVVSIARKKSAFTEEEREMFAYLAGQAAVSIENVELHETISRQAVTDELTGLVNVRRFQEQLDQEIDRSDRFGTPLSLVMIDIDNFKSVNDTYGHQQGDLVLIEVARTLRRLSRDVDVPARYGGEEMSVVLPQTDLVGAEQQAERMRAALEAMEIKRLDGQGLLPITASFGVASYPTQAREKESLIAAADAALYRAKRGGKNRVERAVAEPAAT